MWHEMNIYEVLKEKNTDERIGLSTDEAKKRRIEYGLNKLNQKKKESLFIKFIKQFNDFMIIILIIASIISLVLAKMEGTNDYIDSIIIIAIVIFNAILGLIQESKAEKSIEALQKMSSPTAKVKRDEKIIEVSSEEIVPGDIVILEAGKFVPADCRLINSYNLKIEEAALTGENIPVEKDAKKILKKDIAMGDMVNFAFATTIVIGGHAEAVVTETGMNTRVGRIANMIINDESPETPIQKKLGEVGKNLGIICLGICFLIFIIGIFKKIEIKEYAATIENFFEVEKKKYHEIYFLYRIEFLDDEDKKIDYTMHNMEGKEYLQYKWLELDKIDEYDISRVSSSSYTRRTTSNCYNCIINRCNKNGKEKCNNKKATSGRNIGK